MRLSSAVLLLSATLLASCSPFLRSVSPAGPAVLHTGFNGKFEYEVDLGEEPKDLYFVFTNTNLDYSAASYPALGSISVEGIELAAPGAQAAPASAPEGSRTRGLDAYRLDPFASRRAPSAGALAASRAAAARFDVEGGTGSFRSISDAEAMGFFDDEATCRKVVASVPVADGSTRTLNIWVADDCWAGSGEKKHEVSQAMVEALADEFLAPGPANDIYDWVTSVLGPEWGPSSYADLVGFDGEITILLSDIERDDADDGGIVGYFWAGNSIRAGYEADSNERVMFVVDAVMYANPDPAGLGLDAPGYVGGAWSPASYWAEETFSTLAHEFQHMIHFYQKGIVARGDGRSAEVWIDEMCSMLVEDLVAEKLGIPGPRGVAGSEPGAGAAGNREGRIPLFNLYMTNGLTKTSNYGILDYSFSYAFGAWLARNYGGAGFVRRLVRSPYRDELGLLEAVEAASGREESMRGLLGRWGVAVLASSRSGMPPGYRLNEGAWFASSAGGVAFNLGSIDFFNYSYDYGGTIYDGPRIYGPSSPLPIRTQPKASNVYYLAGRGLTGKRSWTIETPEGVVFSAYAAEAD
ncbi:MAG TPA: peptidase M30 [Spirochaetales bacterium]|nr:peptidase M30 [Spirochaetales bacterium]HRY54898.1 peptidase M30 [Spirochaetia bacterium]HRZ65918.1 peptidase M30 [Spirochaetia bacterium]